VVKLDHRAIADCFNACFAEFEATNLVGGAAEPLYVPASATRPACLFYREDHAASALHEAAHWCIAGKARREKVDFGYPYSPPPRTDAAQQIFYKFELAVQALESLFCQSAGLKFTPSADNLAANTSQFTKAIQSQRFLTQAWLRSSTDSRARILQRGLIQWTT